MKIPKNIKLPRKLKKELKKGIERKEKQFFARNEAYFYTYYTGSNTKSFLRLCKFARKEEKKEFERYTKQTIDNIFSAENLKSDISKEDIIKFQNNLFNSVVWDYHSELLLVKD